MTDEFVQIIAETEGTRTPTKKRTQKEVDTAFANFTKKRAKGKKKPAAKAGKSAKSATAKKPEAPTPVDKPKTVPATTQIGIARETISANPGHTSTAGYDPKTKNMHVEFSKGSVWEYPETPAKDWSDWHATFADAEINSGNYFRKNFRNRTYVRVTEPKAAPAAAEVSA